MVGWAHRPPSLTVTLDLVVPEIMSDRQGLREAVANLLSNAVRFSPRQGATTAASRVRQVAQRHGGRAWAESAPGQGSTFFLAFPDPR
jgi:signal transduction histidine kinase